MASIPNNREWHKLFEKWAELPALWHTNSEEFKDKTLRNKAWRILLQQYRRIDPEASFRCLKQRLHNIRTCYRRELRKVEMSKTMNWEYVYEPALWYYEKVHFLGDQFQEATMKIEHNLSYTEEVEETERNYSPPPEIQRKMRFSPEPQDEKDESSAYVESWTTTLRRLPRNQQILTKKAIADVLFLAETGKLTRDSVPMSSSFRHPIISSSAGTLTPVCLYTLTPTANESAARSTMRSPTQFYADENSEADSIKLNLY